MMENLKPRFDFANPVVQLQVSLNSLNLVLFHGSIYVAESIVISLCRFLSLCDKFILPVTSIHLCLFSIC